MDEKLDMSQKYALTAQKANCILGCTQSSVDSGLKEMIQMAVCKSKQSNPGSCFSIDQSVLGKESTEE